MSPKLALERTRAQLYSTVSAASAVFVAPRTHAVLRNLCTVPYSRPHVGAFTPLHSHRCIHTVAFTFSTDYGLYLPRSPQISQISPHHTVGFSTDYGLYLPASPQISPHHTVGFSTDYGLPKSEAGVPKLKDEEIALRMRYSHFGCNVVHEDVCVKAGAEVHTASVTAFLFELCFFSPGGCRRRPRPPRPQGRGRGYRR